jgi:two-component system NarL family response regulator
MTPKIARKLIVEFRLKDAPPGELEAVNSGSVLTPRQIAILRLVVKGFSYGEIAEQLKISPHTVHAHIKNVYEKLQARSRQDMLLKARRLGAI